MSTLRREVDTFAAAARWADGIVRTIPSGLRDPAGDWERSALGEWDRRTLVGHTSRALLTVEQYSGQPAEHAELDCPEAYFERVSAIPAAAPKDIAARASRAAADLGDDIGAAFHAITERVVALIHEAEDRPITTIAGTILLSDYLPTRTFELTVHGLDIARAISSEEEPPPAALESAVALASSIALRNGRGIDLLLALTGREPRHRLSMF